MLKSKLTKIDFWIDEDDYRHVIYFDDDYRVREVIYDLNFTFFKEVDEIENPELSNYRIVLEKAGNV
jgi:hypothetical protein